MLSSRSKRDELRADGCRTWLTPTYRPGAAPPMRSPASPKRAEPFPLFFLSRPTPSTSVDGVPTVQFTANLRRHIDCPEVTVAGETVAAALAEVWATHPKLRGYCVDEHGRLRKHVVAFVDGAAVKDRVALSDPVGPDSDIFVMQALSGG